MKKNLRILAVIACAVVCIVIGWTAFAQLQRTASLQKWEYRDGANVQIDQMNALDEQGWELATMVQYGRDYYYIFKRPKQ